MRASRVLLVGDTDSIPHDDVQRDESLDVETAAVTEALAAERRPACVVLGRLADHDVVDVLAELREQGVPAVVCAELDPERMNNALATGLAGYVPPDAPDAADLLHDAVTDVVTDERRYENLERYLDRMTDAFLALDSTFEFVYLNERAATLLGVDPEAVIGERVLDEFPAAADTTFQYQFEHAMETGEAVTFEEYFPPLDTWFSVTAYPSETGLSVYFRDVSERIERQHELEHRVAQQEAISALGRRAVEDGTVDELLADATERVGDVLDADAVAVFKRDTDGGVTLRARDGNVDAAIAADGTGETPAFAEPVGGNTAAEVGLETDEPVVVDDVTADDRIGDPTALAPNATAAAVTRVGSSEDPWGSIVAYGDEAGAFDGSDATFLESVGSLLATAIERIEQEREIEQQRDRLALLAKFDAVVQDVIGHAAEAESREEIENYVCDRLAETAGVEFAWISDGEDPGRTVTPSQTPADTADYVDEITITTDNQDTADGPTGRAVETGEIQVTNDIATDPDFEPWREAALERGFRSSAAVPLVYRDHQYGVLNIYADHPEAFPAEVQQALSRLGENLAHTLNALDRRDALITDAQTELEFHARDADLFVVRAATETGATIRLDGLVERSEDEGEYLAYLSVEDADAAAVAAVAPAANVADATVVREDEDGGVVSIVVPDPTLANAVATHGAELVSLTATPDGATFIVRLPRSVDTRTVVETVTDAVDDAEFRAKRTREQPTETDDDHGVDQFDLTDRQREALESALHAGYFDWPRGATGEAVAESMGITAPTFQEHLRSAQQELLGELFDISTDE